MPQLCKLADQGCKRSAVEPTGLCKEHQGSTKELEHNKATVQQGIKRQATKSDTAAVSRVLEGMLEELEKVRSWEYEARMKVDELEGEWRRADKAGGEHLRSEVAVYERALDRTCRVLRDMTKLDIDSRMAGIEKKQAEFLLMVMTRAMDKAGLDQQLANQVVGYLSRELDMPDEQQ